MIELLDVTQIAALLRKTVRYALVDRTHELERLLLEGDSGEILRNALELTRELLQVLEDAVG